MNAPVRKSGHFRLLSRSAAAAMALITTVATASPRVHQPEEPTTRRPWRSYSQTESAPTAPRQFGADRPKVDYSPTGRAIMAKRYANTPHTFAPILDFEAGSVARMKYRKNKKGLDPVPAGFKLLRTKGTEDLSTDQQRVLARWGQPDWLRGSFRSTRGDSVTEWLFERQNKIFQWVDGDLVYHGPVTDVERTMLVHGAPTHVMITHVEPNIRRETFIYRETFRSMGREKMYSFSNGKLIYSQETP